MVVAVVALEVLVLTLVTIALAHAAFKLMAAIGVKLSDLPFPFNQLAGPVTALASVISNALGKLEQGIDHLIGASWHLLASFLDHQWRHLVWSAHLFAGYGEWLWRLTHSHAITKHLVTGLIGGAHSVGAAVKTLEKEYHGIEHRVKTLERDIAKGIGHDLRIQVAGIEQDITKLENKVIPNIRADVATAEGDVTALRKWITANFPAVGTDAFVGAIAAALSLLGLGGLRCNSLLNSLKNRGCGLWNGLEDLLGLFVDAFALTHLCDLPKWINEILGPFEGELVNLISSAANAVCAQPPSGWAELPAPPLSLPTSAQITKTL